MIRYKRGDDYASVVAVECPTPGWPHRDANGDTQYENSHFDTAAEAWECVLANARAGVSLALSSLENAEAVLAKTKEEVVYIVPPPTQGRGELRVVAIESFSFHPRASGRRGTAGGGMMWISAGAIIVVGVLAFTIKRHRTRRRLRADALERLGITER